MSISFFKRSVNISLFMLFLTINFLALMILCSNNYSFALENQNPNKENKDFNIIAVADVGCSLRAQENIKNIEKLDPELFLVSGDLSYEKTPDCWFNMTKSLDSKTKIAIGNHDDNKGKKEKKDKDTTTIDEKKEPLLKRFPLVGLNNLFEQNSIDIEIPALDKFLKSNTKVPALKVDNEQYQFVLEDLEKTSQNKDIDWIFVMFHKPMYSPLSKQFEEYIIRDKYQPIFDKYGVDLVIQGHNHIYSRTLPLSLNKLDISKPIVDQSSSTSNNNIFTNPNGTIFLVVGVGGDELHRIENVPYYVANQYNKGFGFVDLKINGKRLDGVFYDINLNCQVETTEKTGKEMINLESCVPSMTNNNNLKVIDKFSIEKIS